MNEQNKTFHGQKILSDSDICRNAERGNSASPEKKVVKLTGTLTSRIEKKGTNEPYYYGFFKLENQKGEFPVVFKTKPAISKGSQVQLTGTWAQSNGSRPSFTCQEYQILSNPPPLTTQSLKEQIQKLLSLAWEHQKHWTKTTKFLTKKQEQLKELEKYQKHPPLLKAYLSLKAFYYSNEYREQLILNELEFINKIASEIEPIEKQIKALRAKNNQSQALDNLTSKSIQTLNEALAEKDQIIQKLQAQLKAKTNLTNQQLLILLGERLTTGEIKRDWYDEHEENTTKLYIGERENFQNRTMTLYLEDYRLEPKLKEVNHV